jgi:glutathione peroxidase
MNILDHKIARLDGAPATLGEITGGVPALVVNVASRCGLTPQYAGLEQLYETYAPRGFTVVGVPCNQFLGQEPGSADEIAQFCSATYGVTFPMTEKIEVNGEGRHAIYCDLVQTPVRGKPDTGGSDVSWNFEKFLLTADGHVAARFLPQTEPDDPDLVAAVESLLPAAD